MKTFFSEKGLASSHIVLKEKDNLITGNQKLADLFEIYVINITNSLELKIVLKILISLSVSLSLCVSEIISFLRIITAFLKI